MAPTAGSAFEVTITALSGADTLDAAYTGPQCVTFSGPDDAPGGAAPAYPPQGACGAGSSVAFTDGLATVSLTLVDPETTTLQVTDNSSGMSGTSPNVTVAEAATTSTATATPSTTGPSSTTTTTLGPTTTPAGTSTLAN